MKARRTKPDGKWNLCKKCYKEYYAKDSEIKTEGFRATGCLTCPTPNEFTVCPNCKNCNPVLTYMEMVEEREQFYKKMGW